MSDGSCRASLSVRERESEPSDLHRARVSACGCVAQRHAGTDVFNTTPVLYNSKSRLKKTQKWDAQTRLREVESVRDSPVKVAAHSLTAGYRLLWTTYLYLLMMKRRPPRRIGCIRSAFYRPFVLTNYGWIFQRMFRVQLLRDVCCFSSHSRVLMMERSHC